MKQTKLEAFGVLQKKPEPTHEQFALRVNHIIAALATEYSALLHDNSDSVWTIDADALKVLQDLSAAFEQRIVERAAVFGEYRTTEEDEDKGRHGAVSDKQKQQQQKQKKRPRRRLREMLVEPADFELAIQTLQQENSNGILLSTQRDAPTK